MFGDVSFAKGAILALYSALLGLHGLPSSIGSASSLPAAKGSGQTSVAVTVSVPSTAPPSDGTQDPQSFSFMGCFRDHLALVRESSSQVLPVHMARISDVMSRTPSKQQPRLCVHACWDEGYRVAGVRTAHQCWCGTAVSPQAPLADCQRCRGNGSYLCGSSVSMATYLLDRVPPKASICNPSRVVLVGGAVTLQCTSLGEGPVRYSWYRHAANGSRQLLEVDGENMHVDGGQVTIKKADTSHSGPYVCVVRSDFFPDLADSRSMANAIIHVQTAPKVKLLASGQNTVGGQVRFTCSAAGDNPILLSWSKDGAPLGMMSSERVFIETWVGNVSSVLTLSHLAPADSGRYSCVARNQRIVDIVQRSDAASVDVRVNDPQPLTTVVNKGTSSKTPASTTTAPTQPVPASNTSSNGEEGRPVQHYSPKRMIIVVACLCAFCLLLLAVVLAVVIQWRREKKKPILPPGACKADHIQLGGRRPGADTMQSLSSHRFLNDGSGVVVLNSDKSGSLLSIRTADLPFPFNQPRRSNTTACLQRIVGEEADSNTDCSTEAECIHNFRSIAGTLPRGTVPPWLPRETGSSARTSRGDESDFEEPHPNGLLAYNLSSTPASVYFNPCKDCR